MYAVCRGLHGGFFGVGGAGELAEKDAVRPTAKMGLCDRKCWIRQTTKSIPGPRSATNRSVLFALRAFFRVPSFTVHGFCLRTCRADAADADAICGGLGASFRVAVARVPWNMDELRTRGVSV